MREPVTIQDQKFIYRDDKGWIDEKTKQPAPENLLKLLDAMSPPTEQEVNKPKRLKISKNVNTFKLSKDTEYGFDENTQQWVDIKTKVPASKLMQEQFNSLTDNKAFKAIAEETEQIAKSFGMLGEIAQQNVVPKQTPKTRVAGKGTIPRPATKVKSRSDNIAINTQLVAMIGSLSSIDGLLKQQLNQQKELNRETSAQLDEDKQEAKDHAEKVQQVTENKTADAERVSGGDLLLLGAAGLLIAKYIDPIMNVIKDVAEGMWSVGTFVIDIAKSIGGMFSYFTSGSGDNATPQPSASPSTTSPSDKQPEEATPAAPREKSLTATMIGGAVAGGVVGKMLPFVKTRTGIIAGAGIAAYSYFRSSGNTSTPTNTTPSTTTTSAPSNVAQPSNKSQPQPDAEKETGEKTNTDSSTPIPKNSIVDLGHWLQKQGLVVTGHSAFGGREYGKHARNSRHYRDMAIDINAPGRVWEAYSSTWGPKFDALNAQLRAAGYNTIWRAKDHYNHLHASVGGPEGGGGGGEGWWGGDTSGSGSIITDAISSIGDVLHKIKKTVFDIVDGKQADLPKYSPIGAKAADTEKIIRAAAVADHKAEVAAKTPPQNNSPKTAELPNINPQDLAVQIASAPTGDIRIVADYMKYFGIEDVPQPVKAVAGMKA